MRRLCVRSHQHYDAAAPEHRKEHIVNVQRNECAYGCSGALLKYLDHAAVAVLHHKHTMINDGIPEPVQTSAGRHPEQLNTPGHASPHFSPGRLIGVVGLYGLKPDWLSAERGGLGASRSVLPEDSASEPGETDGFSSHLLSATKRAWARANSLW